MNEPVFPVNYEIELINSSGPWGQAGSPDLVARAEGICHSGRIMRDGRIVILSRDRQAEKWIEYNQTTGANEFAEIVELLRRLGLPDRLPEVEGVHLTAPFWIKLSIKLTFGDRRFYLDLSAAEGIKGKDAKNLQLLFDYLFRHAGFSGDSILRR